jgi:hypothetical protein
MTEHMYTPVALYSFGGKKGARDGCVAQRILSTLTFSHKNSNFQQHEENTADLSIIVKCEGVKQVWQTSEQRTKE